MEGKDWAWTGALVGWRFGDLDIVLSDADALSLRRWRAAPRAAINVTAVADDKTLADISRLMTICLDIEVSAGFAEDAADAHLRRDHRAIALSLAGVAERLVSEGLAFDRDEGRAPRPRRHHATWPGFWAPIAPCRTAAFATPRSRPPRGTPTWHCVWAASPWMARHGPVPRNGRRRRTVRSCPT
jgi:hypothetical protein